MRAYMVSYDLNKPGQDYEKLLDKLRAFGTYFHCLKSTWIIVSDLSVVQIRDYLRPAVDPSDDLIVVGLAGDAAWSGFNEAGSDWLKKQLEAVAA